MDRRTDGPIFPEAGPSRDYSKPSVFELLAQEQLRDLLHPVFRYILSYFAQRHPRYLLRILNYHEEAFAFVLILLERHHLKKHNASLSEHFYGLKLRPVTTIPTPRLSAFEQPKPRSLSQKQRYGLLLFLVGVPYIRARAQDYYERIGGADQLDEDGEVRSVVLTSKPKRLFRSMYPYLNLSFDLSLLAYDVAYMFDRTDSYRPWHRWLGLRIGRRGPDDDESDDGSLLSKLPPLLPPLLLLLKLSQWWYSPASPRAHSAITSSDKSTTSRIHAAILPPRRLPILPSADILPPAPPTTPSATEKDPVDAAEYRISKEGYGNCPLCSKKWQNPAILPSGWVVCWRCGWEAIEGDDEDADVEEKEKEAEGGDGDQVRMGSRRKGRCPITGVEVLPGQLRRVLV